MRALKGLFTLAVAAAATLTLTGCFEPEPDSCEAGDQQLADDGCNLCTCDTDGQWSCTEMACADCDPGETRDAADGCNTCTCTDEGSWACTEMACETCTPGETRDAGDDCNSCTCMDDGTWACTAMACLECTPGEVRDAEDGCNTCTCTDTGEWACTLMDCGECTPGDTREAEDGCDCICDEYGFWACDLGCEDFCTPGASRPADDGCNTCTCVDGNYWACTEMACGDECASDADCFVGGCSGQICSGDPGAGSTCEWRDEYACYDDDVTSCGCFAGRCGWEPTDALAECLDDPPCEPGDERMIDDCNSCFCMDDGSWACTGVICPECEPGESRMDEAGCGCVCDEYGFWACDDGCATECTPGETRPADDGCNHCTCLDDGMGWACTEMACAPVLCESDADCMATGCSGQICAAEPVDSTCEWLDIYACYDDAHCGCFDGVCHWEETDALVECLGE